MRCACLVLILAVFVFIGGCRTGAGRDVLLEDLGGRVRVTAKKEHFVLAHRKLGFCAS